MQKHDTLLLVSSSPDKRNHLRYILGEAYNLLEASGISQANMLLEQNGHCIAAVLWDMSDDESSITDFFKYRQENEYSKNFPLVAISSGYSSEAVDRAFVMGALDVIPIDYNPVAMLYRIGNIIALNLHRNMLAEMVAEQAALLENTCHNMVDALSSIIEYRSVESGQHILRIRHFTKILLEEVARCCPEYGLDAKEISLISSASALHDIGKIAIPDSVLMKPGPLDEKEWELMKTHSLTGCRILESVHGFADKEYFKYAHNICHYHHERWDGKGYPEGLEGDTIPICAQVVGLADVYDALTTKRSYKDALSLPQAVNMILRGECGIFSPKLLECFKHVISSFEELACAYMDGLNPGEESFDVELPPPQPTERSEGLERTQAKYYALVHQLGAFLIELDLDNGLFHTIYNPYPEFAQLSQARNLKELQRKILDELALPEERHKIRRFLIRDIKAFLDEGLRRKNYRFTFRSYLHPEGENYSISLLRIAPSNQNIRTLAILCSKSSDAAPVEDFPEGLTGYDYCCLYDRGFSLVKLGRNKSYLAGYSLKEIKEELSSQLLELVHPDDREALHQEFRVQLRDSSMVKARFRIRAKDGRTLTVMSQNKLVFGEGGKEYIYARIMDISDIVDANRELAEKLQHYEVILGQTENVLFQWDAQTCRLSFSDTWEKIFGFKHRSGSINSLEELNEYFHPDDVPVMIDKMALLEKSADYESFEVRMLTAKANYIWCRIRASTRRDSQGKLLQILGIIININAEKQAALMLQDRAEQDPLTRLLNKEAGRKQAEEYISRFPSGALIVLDLDGFKDINDEYGHLFGDRVLLTVSKALKKQFRNQDIIARVGGDEFMVLMRGTSDRELVRQRCEQLIASFENLIPRQFCRLPIGCSIGVALSPEDGRNYNELFRHADQALYKAKAMGKNRCIFYDNTRQGNDYKKHANRKRVIGTDIDSELQPGLSENHIVQHVFQMLYTSKNMDRSINDILALIGRQMNVSRVYIFENSEDDLYCNNSYEWCNTGIKPEIDNLQHISYSEDIPGYLDCFNEEDILYCQDIKELNEAIYNIVAPQGIKSLVHCAMRNEGRFRGYIGFDDCVHNRLWTKEHIEILSYLSEVLSTFIFKSREHEMLRRQKEEFSSVLDNQDAFVYIIEPESRRVKYLNQKAKVLCPQIIPGLTCHKALFDKDEPCSNCPAANIRNTGSQNRIIRDEKYGTRLLADAAMIRWEGEDSCLVTCRRLPDE